MVFFILAAFYNLNNTISVADLNGIDILCFPIPNQSFSVGYLGRRYHISDKLRYVKMLLTNEFTIDSTFNPRKKKARCPRFISLDTLFDTYIPQYQYFVSTD